MRFTSMSNFFLPYYLNIIQVVTPAGKEEVLMMSIGQRIKECRELLKMTQESLANKIGTTKQTIYKYENDIITNIPPYKVELLAKALAISPAYLMGWIDNDAEKGGGKF